jgi:hypothetical protein
MPTGSGSSRVRRVRGQNIPPKRNRIEPICFSDYLYRARNLVERFFNKIKQCRRIAPRYDKLAANYLAFVKLRLWLRAYESTPQSDDIPLSMTRRHAFEAERLPPASA